MKTDDREVDEGMIKQEDMSFPKMKENIKKAGNLFYQYRACRREAATIYDIENIRHGVVFARTPLQMNDPFDSMIGFSVEKIYDECIDIALDQVEMPLDSNLRLIIKNILKYRIVRKTIGFIDALNQLNYSITYFIAKAVPPEDIGLDCFFLAIIKYCLMLFIPGSYRFSAAILLQRDIGHFCCGCATQSSWLCKNLKSGGGRTARSAYEVSA